MKRNEMLPAGIKIVRDIFKTQLTTRIVKHDFSTETNSVLFQVVNKKGIITLNRPKKLNSIDKKMVSEITDHLIKWKDNTTMVIIQGTGRAFCAGGDVVSITKNGPKGSTSGKDFFRSEYGMNGLIGAYPVPYVALIDGITMGGGVGLSVHGKVRIATEKTLFAMPETAIGLFPDVGMTYVLSRQPRNLGVFLGLTGHRLNGTDLAKIGIATHFTESKNIENIFKELVELKKPKDLNDFMKNKTQDISKLSDLSLTPHLKVIEKCFSPSKVEEIYSNLQNDGSEFARQTLKTLQMVSPLSLKITLKAIKLAADKSLNECLKTEYRIAHAMCDARVSTDFYEGVRAQLIDKDKKPKWNPPTLEQVTDKMVDKVFKALPPNEELKL